MAGARVRGSRPSNGRIGALLGGETADEIPEEGVLGIRGREPSGRFHVGRGERLLRVGDTVAEPACVLQPLGAPRGDVGRGEGNNCDRRSWPVRDATIRSECDS